ncbi:MAG: prolipoprotein diacylglyceryl transferase [Candidatus Oceanisphaera merdipullorum]|nr:prolipoprotein diacylglyceryl transferase [Candidatus Oceanisphaera merdipullorum]
MSESHWVFPGFDPIAIQIGPLAVHWYGLMYLIGFVFAWLVANWRAAQPGSGWTKDQVSDVLFYGFLGVIIGGRLGYVFFYQFDTFLADPLYLVKIWTGGMSFHGGLIGVITALWLFARKHKKTFFAVSDFIAPLIPFGLGAGRIGNFINGELWGRVTDVSWGIIFPAAGMLPRHASQLYQFALEGVVLLIILNVAWLLRAPRGAISGLFLFCYGLFRFMVEFVREPDAQLGLYLDVFSMGQLLSMPMMLAGGIMLWAAFCRPQWYTRNDLLTEKN